MLSLTGCVRVSEPNNVGPVWTKIPEAQTLRKSQHAAGNALGAARGNVFWRESRGTHRGLNP
jgi:hypothetical protein